MRYLSYSQVSVGDVIRFGPKQRWGLVNKIDSRHWELIWVYGTRWGDCETVTPDSRAVYVAMSEIDARKERVKLLL